MRHKERVAVSGQFPSDRIGPGAVGEALDNYRGVQNDHRSSRSSRITRAAVILVRIGLARRVLSNHSWMVGRSAARSSSLLMKPDRLMPSRAARDFRVACTCSGTSLTWIILDMCSPYKTCAAHVNHLPAGCGAIQLIQYSFHSTRSPAGST